MPQTHNCSRTIFFRSPRANLQLFRQIAFLDDQRMIAGCSHRNRKALEYAAMVVKDLAGFAVHQLARAYDPATERFSDGLMSQANAQDRDLAGKPANQLHADSRVSRSAWAGRNHNPSWVHGLDLGNTHL